MVKAPSADDPPEFLSLADRKLAMERLARSEAMVRQSVSDVFDAADPNAAFVRFARCFIGKQGKDLRTEDVNLLRWYFGIADRAGLKKLLRSKSIVGAMD